MAKCGRRGGGRRASGRGGATATATGGQAQQQKTSGEFKVRGLTGPPPVFRIGLLDRLHLFYWLG